MSGLKTLIVVIIFVGITYLGIEPYAHTKLNPHTSLPNYNFAEEDINLANENIKAAQSKVQNLENELQKIQKNGDQKDIQTKNDMLKNAKKELETKQNVLKSYNDFWNDINAIDLSKGDANRGAELFDNAGCSGCHGLEIANKPAVLSPKEGSEAYGVNPPDLSSAGRIYDAKFLAALIKNPVIAMKIDHKFNDENPFPMPGFFGAGGEDINLEIADIVAYLKSVAPKQMDDKSVFVDACLRCHDVKYDNLFIAGNRVNVSQYLGSTPPDLSMVIRSKNVDYLHKFMNDTQKVLPGTAMPRVGLTRQSEEQIVNYLEKIGDSKKEERQKTTIYIMIYFAILSIFAALWKNKIWSKLH